jgi:hypothetical protein
MCSKFGAPPAGRSPFHTGLHPKVFKPFQLKLNDKALFMDYAVMHQSSNHTASLMLVGRETRRTPVRSTRASP